VCNCHIYWGHPVLCLNVLHAVNITTRVRFIVFFIFVVLLNILNINHSMYIFHPVCPHGIILIVICSLRILWGMASNRVSCMVMAVSKQACYLPSGLTILSSFNILGEFLPFQTFEEAGESPKYVILVCLWAHESFIVWYLCLIAVIMQQSGWVFASSDIAVCWFADEICEAVHDVHEQINWGVICG
jgi:hypothetical protein